MINVTENVPASQPVSKVAKWEVIHLDDQDKRQPFVLTVQINVYSTGGSPWPINPVTLYIQDTGSSQVLTRNPSSTSLMDEYVRTAVVLAGTPYTTLVAAMDGATGRNNTKKAVEAFLVQVGALPSNFAGT